MKMKKIIVFLLFLLFLLCFFSYSNEKNANFYKNKRAFSFSPQTNYLTGLSLNGNNSIKSDIQLYRLSNAQLANIGLAMGIAGSVMTGIGTLCIIPGSVLMGISIVNYWAPYSPQRIPPTDPGYYMWFTGIGLLAGGITLVVLGVPLAIIGFILYFNGGKFASVIESDRNGTKLGFAIKL